MPIPTSWEAIEAAGDLADWLAWLADHPESSEGGADTPSDDLWSDLAGVLRDASAARPWAVEGAIEGSPLIMLSGPEKSGKSWITIQLAVATVTGGAWLGKFPVRRSGSVVYLDAEYGPHEFARRVARIARGMGADPFAVLARIRHLYSSSLVLTRGDAVFREVLAAIKREPPALIVLDPLRNHLDGSENDSDAIVRAYRCLDALRVAAGCPTLASHHLNKGGSASGSRAISTRGDLLIEGSDCDVPLYTVRGRTVRPTIDPIAEPFQVEITHEHDEDDAVATTRLMHRSGDANGRRRDFTAAQLEKVRAVVEAAPSGFPFVLDHVAEAAHVKRGAVRACMIALEGEGLLAPRLDADGNPKGWDRA